MIFPAQRLQKKADPVYGSAQFPVSVYLTKDLCPSRGAERRSVTGRVTRPYVSLTVVVADAADAESHRHTTLQSVYGLQTGRAANIGLQPAGRGFVVTASEFTLDKVTWNGL